jgi:hypothetical protein
MEGGSVGHKFERDHLWLQFGKIFYFLAHELGKSCSNGSVRRSISCLGHMWAFPSLGNSDDDFIESNRIENGNGKCVTETITKTKQRKQPKGHKTFIVLICMNVMQIHVMIKVTVLINRSKSRITVTIGGLNLFFILWSGGCLFDVFTVYILYSMIVDCKSNYKLKFAWM